MRTKLLFIGLFLAILLSGCNNPVIQNEDNNLRARTGVDVWDDREGDAYLDGNATTTGNSYIGGALDVAGDTTLTNLDVSGAFTLTGTAGAGGIDMNSEIISNIGNAGTDFVAGGGFNLDGDLNLTGTSTNHLLLPLNNDPATPTLAFGDGDTGFYEASADVIGIAIGGISDWFIHSNAFQSNLAGGPSLNSITATAILPAFSPNKTDIDTGIGYAATDQLSLIAGGVEGHRITEAAGAITHELVGEVQGATFSNQMTNLASSQILGLTTDPRFLNMLNESPLSDMITNGDFSDATYTDTSVHALVGWVQGGTHDATNKFTIVAGECRMISDGTLSYINQVVLTIGQKYIITVNVTDITAGSAYCSVGGTDYLLSLGINRFVVTASTNGILFKRVGGVADITFDDVVITPVYEDISMKGHDGQYMGTWASGDRINKGSGWALDPNGTDAYIDLGDSDDFSFGDGTNDSPFTVFGLIEVVDTGGFQGIVMKFDITTGSENREFAVNMDGTEKLKLLLYDESANAYESEVVDASLSAGMHSIVTAYDGRGGVNAADGITIYIDGKEVASTRIASGTYVAMENLTTPLMIGASIGTGGVSEAFMQGDIGHVGIDAVEWSAADAWKHYLNTKGLNNL